MPRRVRLRWNRNREPEVLYYRVYRSERPYITHENNRDDLIMKITHPKKVNALKEYNEVPVRQDPWTFKLKYEDIILKNKDQVHPFIVHVNDLYRTDYTLDLREGLITFDSEIPVGDAVIVKQYSFDGVQGWDFGEPEDGKNYFGPEAKDTSPPNAPENLTITKDLVRNRIALKWATSTRNGKVFYYKIDAAIDDTRYSRLSNLASAVLQEPLADRPYLVEKSEDGIVWREIAKVKANEFYEYSIDTQPPDPIKNLVSAIHVYRGLGKVDIKLSWKKLLDLSVSKTAMYRVKAQNKLGFVSPPSNIVGPIDFKVDFSHILIRRKVKDGLLPSFDGNDAVTVSKINNIEVEYYIDTVDDKTEYVYGMWVVDKAGNYSAITFTEINVLDTMAPDATDNLIGMEFHTIVG